MVVMSGSMDRRQPWTPTKIKSSPYLPTTTQAGDYGQAAQRLAQAPSLLAADPATDVQPAASAYASLLGEWAAGGYKTEADLFLARAVLHILARVEGPGNMDAAGAYARAVLEAAVEASPALAAAAKESQLVHFAWVLVELVQVRFGWGGWLVRGVVCAPCAYRSVDS